jgi:hypothetical protein
MSPPRYPNEAHQAAMAFKAEARQMTAPFDDVLVMPPDVFEGATGMLVLCQEWTHQRGEQYVRIMVPMAEASRLAEGILAAARGARG